MRPRITIRGCVRRSGRWSVSSAVFFSQLWAILDISGQLWATLNKSGQLLDNSGQLWGRTYWSTLGLVFLATLSNCRQLWATLMTHLLGRSWPCSYLFEQLHAHHWGTSMPNQLVHRSFHPSAIVRNWYWSRLFRTKVWEFSYRHRKSCWIFLLLLLWAIEVKNKQKKQWPKLILMSSIEDNNFFDADFRNCTSLATFTFPKNFIGLQKLKVKKNRV